MSTTHNYVLFTAPTGSTSIGLTGQDVNTGLAFPVDERSLVSAFELQTTSPAIVPATSPASNADVKAVGVTSDFKATGNAVTTSTKIYFAIATHGAWATPTDVTFKIFVVPDRKGTVVYVDPDTGKKVETSVTRGNVKCQWKAESAQRWTGLGVG